MFPAEATRPAIPKNKLYCINTADPMNSPEPIMLTDVSHCLSTTSLVSNRLPYMICKNGARPILVSTPFTSRLK